MRAQSSHANLASASLLITSTLFLFATGAIAADSNHHPKDAAAAKVAADDAYGKLPLSFEANRGQTDRQVKFLSRGSGYALFLTPTEAVMSLKAGDGQRDKKDSVLPVSRRQDRWPQKPRFYAFGCNTPIPTRRLAESMNSRAKATTSSATIRLRGSAIFRPLAK